ncbi:hypothetical protein [Amycolatopsis sp. CA-230715]|uniref:hypothetical protein n=1 Tax=Amycolatopsis sp. CA-230715 TaxID=2745196 RepID=UPI001C02F89D|nr:hypothetical protein [Amycolatopsis sp. CA-230715]QWF81096.1 hypothetical protein HUW46_04522 [Amycolatopsis sp. CA-230715]
MPSCTPGPWPRLAVLLTVMLALLLLVWSGYTADAALATIAKACAVATATAAAITTGRIRRLTPTPGAQR